MTTRQIEPDQLDAWFPIEQQRLLIEQISQRVGLTRTRAKYFVRLWIYLIAKQRSEEVSEDIAQPVPLQALTPITHSISCSHGEAAWLFYGDQQKGSDRAAGMMLSKLAALGLIQKHFDGNTTRIAITLDSTDISPNDNSLTNPQTERNYRSGVFSKSSLTIDDFNPRCDAVPVANLLAINYSWMNRSLDIVPHRITRLLRYWASQYSTGMRVLRRTDNLNPVGFYLLYPTTADSEIAFSSSPTKGLHLASLNEVDPFTIATPSDPDCGAVFIRSWMIDPIYLEQYRVPFLQDAQETLQKMQQDFPNLCDLYTLIIHPSYEAMATAMGFQQIGIQIHKDTQIYWMYQALDRYLTLEIPGHIS